MMFPNAGHLTTHFLSTWARGPSYRSSQCSQSKFVHQSRYRQMQIIARQGGNASDYWRSL